MGFIANFSKTLGAEPVVGLVEAPTNMIAELSVDELYFYVKEMLIDGELVSVAEPKVESREDPDRLFLQVAMPGVISDGLKIDLNGRVLQIYAQRRSALEMGGAYSAFGVYINLPKLVEPESIKFELKNNFLILMFRKGSKKII